MKKLPLFLAALLAAAPLTACGSDASTDTTADSVAGDTTPAETAEHSGVPAGTDLGEETINIWYTTKAASVAETFVDIAGELTGETLDDAIFNANRAVEGRLNCKLNYFNSGVSTSNTGAEVTKLVMADDTSYDLFHLVQWNSVKLATEGLYMNLFGAPYFDFDKPWWDRDYMDALTMGNDRVFMMVGDYAVDRTRCLGCVFYNKAMFEDFYGNPDGLYQEVLDKTWTWERLQQISADVYSDINNDGKTNLGDRLGFAINDYNNIDILYFGADVKISERDEDGNPYLVINNEHTVDVYDKLYKLVYETEGGYPYSGVYNYNADVEARNYFIEGNHMFQFGFFYTAEAMREMKDDYGIIPAPLFDASQEDYVSTTHDIMRMMAVPSNCTKFDAVCAVMEELAFEGYKNVLPEYYDLLLKYKYARDDASAAMIDLIRDGCTIDTANIFGFTVVNPRTTIQEKTADFASKYAAGEAAAIEKIEDYIELFNDIE